MATKKTVTLLIPRDPSSPEVKTRVFGLNGVLTLIPVGVPTEVDPAIYEIYQNSLMADAKAHNFAEEQSRIERETSQKPLGSV